MTKEQYQSYTGLTRRAAAVLPGGERMLKLPTLLCAGIYLAVLAALAWARDPRILPTAINPAVCFLIVTALRPILNRPRPYDVFNLPPVGKWEKGKGKSMPSRHAASAAAISISICAAFPSAPVILGMTALCTLICVLRVLTGKHFPADIFAAVTLSALVAALVYGFFR